MYRDCRFMGCNLSRDYSLAIHSNLLENRSQSSDHNSDRKLPSNHRLFEEHSLLREHALPESQKSAEGGPLQVKHDMHQITSPHGMPELHHLPEVHHLRPPPLQHTPCRPMASPRRVDTGKPLDYTESIDVQYMSNLNMKGRNMMNRPITTRRQLRLISKQGTITHRPDITRSMVTLTLSRKMSGLETRKKLTNMYRILEVRALLDCPAGPEPPAAPSPSAPSSPGSPRKSKKKRPSTSDIGYIWPKDPRPGNPGRWSRGSRLSDVLTGKGPDMYVGRIGVRPREEVSGKTPVAKKATDRYRWDSEKYWSLWGHEHELHCREDYCDDCDRIEGQRVRDNRITNARRGSSERYDFRMRKYREPDVGTWSGVRFCGVRAHTVPREYRDIQGRSYPGNQWHNSVHGAHTD
ncbi:hypothetical protein BJY00DRAFT_310989 [Aspergillus carlsbadensis]|nr:hypothetical protein BJY00DRAFT_310989 [Aspergillus carlsbadensis]